MHTPEPSSLPAFNRPPLAVEQTLAWADAHRRDKAGSRPTGTGRGLPAAGKALRVCAEELRAGRVQIACNNPNCWTVIEVPVDRLGRQFLGLGCPRCQAGLAHRGPDPLTRLAEVLRELSDPRNPVTIEFVL